MAHSPPRFRAETYFWFCNVSMFVSLHAEVKLYFFNFYVMDDTSSNIDEVIRSILNFLFFFCNKISQVQKSIKKNTRH